MSGFAWWLLGAFLLVMAQWLSAAAHGAVRFRLLALYTLTVVSICGAMLSFAVAVRTP